MFDNNGLLNRDDFLAMLEQTGVVIGDANLDGKFETDDLVAIFEKAEYEDDLVGNSNWSSGDWNCDGEFNSTDLVFAFEKNPTFG